MLTNEFTPKLFSLLKQGISKKQIINDVISGIVVGIVALPLAIAFAIASGVSPEKGIITAIIAGIIISLLGGSRVQIGGPTGAFIVIVYAVVQEFGLNGLITATFLSGFMIVGMGLARLGNWLKYIPYPMIAGFTSGIAIIIFSTQINDFFGLGIGDLPSDFFLKWKALVDGITDINIYSTVLALSTVLISFFFRRVSKIIPGSLVAILLTTLVTFLFQLPVETIGSKFGEISGEISFPGIPDIEWSTVKKLIQPAFAIAILGGIESLLSAVVADGMIGGKHRSNIELVAQGIANIFSSMFGGIPATGAVARTATNVKNGGRTPIAGIVHGIVLLGILLLFAPYTAYIPMASLAGILVVVAYHMSEWRLFISLLKAGKNDVIILLTTFCLTVFFDLVIAIEAGIVLSSFIFMKRMSEALEVKSMFKLESDNENGELLFDEELRSIPQNVLLYEINGPLFFGAAQKFQDTVKDLKNLPGVVVLRMRHVPFIDATGTQRLLETIRFFHENHVKVIISGVNTNLQKQLDNSNIYSLLDRADITANISSALARAEYINNLNHERGQH